MGVFFSPAPQKKTLEVPEKEGKARLVPGKNFDFGTEVSLVFFTAPLCVKQQC